MYSSKKSKFEFPFSLIQAVYNECDSNIEMYARRYHVQPDIRGTFFYYFYSLGEREVEILTMRFKEERTYGEIGNKFGLSNERIRQILFKNCSKLRHTVSFKDLYDGMKKIQSRKAAEIAELVHTRAISKIESGSMDTNSPNYYKEMTISTFCAEFELPNRVFNALARANIRQVKDLLDFTNDDLNRIKNFGERSKKQLLEALKKANIQLPVYDLNSM